LAFYDIGCARIFRCVLFELSQLAFTFEQADNAYFIDESDPR
jgi:hypothetical protein